MAVLRLYATEVALDAALGEVLATQRDRAALEVGRGWSSVPRLLREAGAGEVELGPLAESLLVREVLRSSQGRGGVGLASRVRPLLLALRRGGVSPAALREVAPKLLGRARADVAWLAELLERYEKLLRGRVDTAAATRRALQRVASGTLLSLTEIDVVHLHATPLDPTERALVDALVARGLLVRCEVPEQTAGAASGAASVYDDQIADAIAGALGSLEAIPMGVERTRAELGPGPLPTLFAAGSPLFEAQTLARHIRDRLAEGLAPDEVTIVADEPQRRATIAAALHRAGVPTEAQADTTALDAEAVRLVMSILRIAEDGIPRDRLVDLLSARYVKGELRLGEQRIPAGRITRVVREVVPQAADVAAYHDALARWAAGRPTARRPEALAIAEHVLAIVDALAALPAQATLAAHLQAFSSLLERLDLVARARGFRRGAPPVPGGGSGAALASDQAALRALSDLLEALPRAAAQAGLSERNYERAELAAILRAELAETGLAHGGGVGAAVRICSPRTLGERASTLLVLAGAEEGALPTADEEDPILPDESRLVLHRALERELFSRSGLAARRCVLDLARARMRAYEVLVSYSRTDAEGRALLAGPIVEHARVRGAKELRGALQPVPLAEDARSFGELLARLGIEEHAESLEREGLAARTCEALRARLTVIDAPRVARVTRLAALERERARFFAGDAPAGRYDGRVQDAALLAALAAGPLPGGARRPLSASTIGRYVECPQRFFLESVLRLRTLEELGDDLDDRASGALDHLALQKLFTAFAAAKLFPLSGAPAERACIAPALAAAAAAWSATRPRGNEIVWRSRLRSVERMLAGVWAREIAARSADSLVPTYFELSIDGLVMEGDGGEAAVHLGGAIDRVDLKGEHAAVFDYKRGGMQKLTPELREAAFGETSWQLPLYAAALRSKGIASQIDLSFYSLRELAVKSAPAPASLVLERGTDPEAPTLGDRVWERVRLMRQGRFDVAPREKACEQCRLQSACRVVERDAEDSDEEES